ncbi:hypothetical protein FRACYDRAFT_275220 [Fragilariopsis cylindrus CCMP1102]|uniref:Amino acid transporter transmembrane domain-containing protein n=1 Tax=Fragilariopsis cylindrus CCMP1102 TaxID=635003 RepID=A0A1E7FIL3_9STRA|nr:hypothetical protein FRACYDRAFT_275220 [Fragilariopsis cylindrus CCMP1102]|eukprot:OEU18019.1 hypothetical protein FRACYDRAFT_275220 [Fragilariopsis cylindrus CCMP1102]
MWVVWSICISIVTSTVYAAIMAEGMGPWASIQRSFSLGQGQWDSIVGILVPLWVLQVWSKAVLGKLIVYFSIIGDQIVVTNVLATIIGILLLAVAPVFECVIYLDLRVQKEELDSVKLNGEIGSEQDSYSIMVPAVAKQPVAPVVLAELPSLA